MEAASSSTAFFDKMGRDQTQKEQQLSQQTISPTAPAPLAPAPQKKKRNQPGNPNPDAEVIALTPTTLTETNRFVCDVCHKGFQREQNLQLHRRGHNLPWKLKQKNTYEVRRKVYLCPEPTCVHHDPSRALGDLTGIKKHFFRKHGEKRFNCERCSKKYAVHSDWKAHSKTCGTKEYRCDCGIIFSRRDSFVSHRAFCDALSQQTARTSTTLSAIGSPLYGPSSSMSLGFCYVGSHISTGQNGNQKPSEMLSLGNNRTRQLGNLIGQSTGSAFRPLQTMPSSSIFIRELNQRRYQDDKQSQLEFVPNKELSGQVQQLPPIFSNPSNTPSVTTFFNPNLFPNGPTEKGNNGNIPNQFSNGGEGSSLFASVPSHYTTSLQNQNVAPPMSATALLQKATQLGSSLSNSTASLLRSFGSSSSNDSKSGVVGYSFFGDGSMNTCVGNINENEEMFNLNETVDLEQPTHGIVSFSNNGGSNNLTRDFLGVGEMGRCISGDSERETAPTSHAFGGLHFQC